MWMSLSGRSASVVSTSLAHLKEFLMFTPIHPVRTVACFALVPSALLAGIVVGASSATARKPLSPRPTHSVIAPYAEAIHALGDIPLAVSLARHEASRLAALV